MSDAERLAGLERSLADAQARLEALERLVGELLFARPQEPAPAGHAPPAAGRYLAVEVAGRHLGLPLQAVREVVRMAALGLLPGAGPAVRGLLDLRGDPVPVLSLRLALGQPPLAWDLDARIVVVRAAGRTLGLEVDRVVRVQAVAPAEVGPPPGPSAATYVAGVWRGAPFLLLLEPAALVEALVAGARLEALEAQGEGPRGG